MKLRNVLIFPAGTEIGLEILNALRMCKEVRIFGAGQDISNHGKFAFSNYYTIPNIYEDQWAESLVSLCTELSIDYIFPAYDDALVSLCEIRELLPCPILAPSSEICRLTRSKSTTYERLRNTVRVPHLYTIDDSNLEFPLFVKPDRGQGSINTKKVSNHAELKSAMSEAANPIISEYLPGNEYTVDCFSDRDRGLLFAEARVRNRIRNGIAVNTVTIEIPEVRIMAANISQALEMRGAWFFQVKRSAKDELVLMEIAPRIAGSMALNRVTGINFPLLCIFEHERLKFNIHREFDSVELDRSLCNRYLHNIHYSVVYIDLDDTLITNAKVNISIVVLIYQCINKNIPVILLTRHKGNLDQTLYKFRLSGLFDKVIHIDDHEMKSSFISENDAIFIDDSFSERMDVSTRCNILTFDCSMIEILTQQAEYLHRGQIQ